MIRRVLLALAATAATCAADTTAVLFLRGYMASDVNCPYDFFYGVGERAAAPLDDSAGIVADDMDEYPLWSPRAQTNLLAYNEKGDVFFVRYPEVNVNLFAPDRRPEYVRHFLPLNGWNSAWTMRCIDDSSFCGEFPRKAGDLLRPFAAVPKRSVVDRLKLRQSLEEADVVCKRPDRPLPLGNGTIPYVDDPCGPDEACLYRSDPARDRPTRNRIAIDREELMRRGVAVYEAPTPPSAEDYLPFCFVRRRSETFDFDSLLAANVANWREWTDAKPFGWSSDKNCPTRAERESSDEKSRSEIRGDARKNWSPRPPVD